MEKLLSYKTDIQNKKPIIQQLHTKLHELPNHLKSEDKQSIIDRFIIQVLTVSEGLTQDLIQMDALDLSMEERKMRKALIVQAEEMLSELDGIKGKARMMLKEEEVIGDCSGDEEDVSRGCDLSESCASEVDSESEVDSDVEDDVSEDSVEEQVDQMEEQVDQMEEEVDNDESVDDEEDEVYTEAPVDKLDCEEVYDAFMEILDKMKLDIEFQSQNQPHQYLLYSELKNLDRESVSLSFNQDGSFTLTGIIVPSFAAVKSTIEQYGSNDKNEVLEYLYGLCRGRYGRFENSFRLPNNVVRKDIELKYERDHLIAVLPKYQQQRGYHPFPFSYPQMRNPAYY